MNLIEEFNMNDSLGLSGFVVITDNKTGEILLKKHNMILAGAKKVLLSKLLCPCNTNEQDIEPKYEQLELLGLDLLYKLYDTKKYYYKDYYLRYCKFYNIEEDVVYSETINKNQNDQDFLLHFELDKSSPENLTTNNSLCNGSLSFNVEEVDVDSHYRLKISIELKSDQEDPIKFTSLSLVMDHPDNNENEKDLEIPFSRIKFDPIILTQESSLNLTYYVYF